MMATQEDFQRQFTSIMENLLHSAVSETTKLFENAVQEMKAEVVRIRKQNDNIKGNLYSDENPIPTCKGNPCQRTVWLYVVNEVILNILAAVRDIKQGKIGLTLCHGLATRYYVT